jgi:hypothetical protein
MSELETIRFNLQEKTFPYFDDTELQFLLDKHTNNGAVDISAASYEGCLIKAQNDSLKIKNMDVPSNEKYWLRLARRFKKSASGTVKRVDETC